MAIDEKVIRDVRDRDRRARAADPDWLGFDVSHPALPDCALGQPGGVRELDAVDEIVGVQSRISHNTISVCRFSRSGLPVTSRRTCVDDSLTPRSARGGAISPAV
jgi:hypothetical protein